MLHNPFKRVGEPSSFKGLKGPYLFLAMYYVGGAIIVLLIVMALPLSKIIQLSIVGLLAGVLLIKINSFKKQCKDGDIFYTTKKRCRRNINIKGSKFEG